jgi:uncharacterized damage-inducible protein DinB
VTRNPYADDLGSLLPRAALAETPIAVGEIVRRLGPEGLTRSYAPGKWTAGQILAHLAQVELMFQSRLRLALTATDYVAQPFDQDAFMRSDPETDGEAAFRAYVALRRFARPLIEGLTPEDLAMTFRHPDFGELTVEWLLEWAAGHERHHLSQLQQVVAAHY